MKILVVEIRQDEEANAKAAIEASGNSVVMARSLYEAGERMGEVGGVITEMFFTPWGLGGHFTSRAYEMGYIDNPPASGLCVVITALSLGKPVVACTSLKRESIHLPEFNWLCDGYLSTPSYRNLDPFGWVPDKNWDEAVKVLLLRSAQARS